MLTFLFGFGVLGFLAAYIYAESPPIPDKVLGADGTVLFTGADIMSGQHLFQKYGLMQFGSLFGHGAYLGPDFTAQYLHQASSAAVDFYRSQGQPLPIARDRARNEFKQNNYDANSKILTYTPGQVHGFEQLYQFYQSYFGPKQPQTDLRRPIILNRKEIHYITAYFSWAAWVSSTNRPGKNYSYTNNWPAEPLVGNYPTSDAFIWSVFSLVALLGGTGLVLFAFGRYKELGWHRSEEETPEAIARFRPPELVKLTPAQRATAWYFLVMSGLFLAQGLLGGANAHYHVEPGGFYGLNISSWFPYNLTRMWHVQLAILFVATSYMAMGIFLAPMIARREPKHQDKLAIALFGAVVLVAVGSLLGEAASLKMLFSPDGPWWWIGTQGWEYLDLGRLWQILLTIGLAIWVLILIRGLRRRLQTEHPGNMPFLFLYSAISIPVFYAAGMLFGKMSSFAIVDFWRFWVVHLWVEDFLELFTTIMVAYIFVLLGVVRATTATRVIYLDIILYSVGGVIGTMHHLYFSGAPSAHMALGAFFSAMEVIPLMLLTYEAWHFMQLGSYRQEDCAMCTPSGGFPHKWAVMFLIAVGFWNFLGAGVFGFLINLPIVSYYEIGTQFTANHAHAALMGVYGMLAIGFFMFVARYFIPPDQKSERAMKVSFWSLNIGLAWMVFVNLVPAGAYQLIDSFQNGYWHARQPEFFAQSSMRIIEWLRIPGDVLFIVGGIFPVVYLAIRVWIERNRYGRVEAEAETERLIQIYEEG
ncbi:MAG TPA: nitric-oxide reductase large subunit [Armatimonadota bacterium]|nr:nitric-oxide reductase large subunit [Armatimonadota bacterium]